MYSAVVKEGGGRGGRGGEGEVGRGKLGGGRGGRGGECERGGSWEGVWWRVREKEREGCCIEGYIVGK